MLVETDLLSVLLGVGSLGRCGDNSSQSDFYCTILYDIVRIYKCHCLQEGDFRAAAATAAADDDGLGGLG